MFIVQYTVYLQSSSLAAYFRSARRQPPSTAPSRLGRRQQVRSAARLPAPPPRGGGEGAGRAEPEVAGCRRQRRGGRTTSTNIRRPALHENRPAPHRRKHRTGSPRKTADKRENNIRALRDAAPVRRALSVHPQMHPLTSAVLPRYPLRAPLALRPSRPRPRPAGTRRGRTASRAVPCPSHPPAAAAAAKHVTWLAASAGGRLVADRRRQ